MGTSGRCSAPAAASGSREGLQLRLQTWSGCDSILEQIFSVGVFGFCKFLDEIESNDFKSKIRRTKHDLIIKLFTRMDGKSQDESIKPN